VKAYTLAQWPGVVDAYGRPFPTEGRAEILGIQDAWLARDSAPWANWIIVSMQGLVGFRKRSDAERYWYADAKANRSTRKEAGSPRNLAVPAFAAAYVRGEIPAFMRPGERNPPAAALRCPVPGGVQ